MLSRKITSVSLERIIMNMSPRFEWQTASSQSTCVGDRDTLPFWLPCFIRQFRIIFSSGELSFTGWARLVVHEWEKRAVVNLSYTWPLPYFVQALPTWTLHSPPYTRPLPYFVQALPTWALHSLSCRFANCLLTKAWNRPENGKGERNNVFVLPFWGCSSGGVNVPCIYSHAGWVTVGDSGLCCCVCLTSFQR